MATEIKFQETKWVRSLTIPLTYADTTAQRAFYLPQGAEIIDWIVNVPTAFAGGTTTLDVGIRGNPDYFIDGVAVNAVGKAAPTMLIPGYIVTALMEEIWIQIGAGNTAGALRLTCLFSMDTNAGF